MAAEPWGRVNNAHGEALLGGIFLHMVSYQKPFRSLWGEIREKNKSMLQPLLVSPNAMVKGLAVMTAVYELMWNRIESKIEAIQTFVEFFQPIFVWKETVQMKFC